MASDQQIADSLDSLLREAAPGAFTTLNDVVQLLQSRLGLDLSHRTDLIRARVAAFYSSLRRHAPPPQPPQPPLNPVLFAAPTHHLHYPQGPVFRNATEISFSQPPINPPAPNVAASDAPAAKDGSQSKPKRRGGAGGLNKLCAVSPELQTIVGQPAMPRTEIVRQLWAYIRKHNLQDPSNKRKIICNDELRLVFETDSTDMFQMNKLLAKHILPLDPAKESSPQAKRAKIDDVPDVKKDEPNPDVLSEAKKDEPNPDVLSEAKKDEPNPDVLSGAKKDESDPAVLSEAKKDESNPVILSEALASFFGSSGNEMPQSEVFGRLSEYIKVQGLEDPSKSLVICDAKLQELFGCESLPTNGIYDVLARSHLTQRS